MQAVILAGGLATRLLPRTRELPKSLIEVAGRPLIAWQLERLAQCGFERVMLCIGHHGDKLRRFVGTGSDYALRVEYADDGPRLLGTAGALRRAIGQLEPEFLVTYGDSYLPFDYAGPLHDLSEHSDALATLAVHPNHGRWDASNTQISGERVLRYAKGVNDPALDHIDYGAMALRRELVATLPPDVPLGLDSLQHELAKTGRMRALVALERFYEIGSERGIVELDAYLRAAARK